MSWSISFIGTPEKVAAALEANSPKLSGQCKVEYDDALPHLVALVKQNFVTPEYKAKYPTVTDPVISLVASGSGTSNDGVQVQRNAHIDLKTLYGALV